ncbi:hypothetical protein HHL11_27840 [Ramlibacter sp. G-1-2-2]|uniref:LysR substrate-binding domain-containing protein n=1 Tax=Ramlibacter agri TaxID=2728837 RepID=A0A848HGE4_9BURK|nr:hypothetical protein [Ramlibacter agri]NML47593.1 hypothetical protein [Ramlibacter agri]
MAILSSRAVGIPAQALKLRMVPLAEPWATRNVVVCVHADKPLSEVAGRLLEHLRALGAAREAQ